MTITNRLTFKSLLLVTTMLASPLAVLAPVPAAAQIEISVQVAPPILPVYVQPPMPGDGYVWTPGYWAYTDAGYYWVPGTWVEPPEVDVLWTPPYWGWLDGSYYFHDGYWGQTVGFYGGVDYGFGYGGDGYQGGRWQGGHFFYNRTVNNFGSVRIANAYSSRVTVQNHSHVSFNGGAHGLRTQPTEAQLAAVHGHHVPGTSVQASHAAAAGRNPQMAASHNHGHPSIAATAHAGRFEGPGVVAAHASAGHIAPHSAIARTRPTHAAPVQHAAAHPAPMSHVAARPARAEHAAARPAPIQHAAARPARAQHAAGPPARAERAAFHPAPAAHAQPVQHMAARPAPARAAPRPAAARAQPAQHGAPHPAASRAPAGRPGEKR